MSGSLRDQLLKTGIVSKEQAKQAEKQAKSKTHQQQKQKKKKKKQSQSETIDTESISYLATKAREEEIARAKELNREKEAERKQKAKQAQISDLIQCHQENDPDGEIAYHFTEAGKYVQKILVTAKQQQQLVNGQLAIAVLEENYYVIPKPITEKILERIPDAIVHFRQDEEEETINPDDPYAAYIVPDDLMW